MRKKMLAAVLGLSMAAMTPAAVLAEATEAETAEIETVSGSEEAEEGSEAETQAEEYFYSSGYDENGRFAGVKALDYVTLPDYSTIELNRADVVPSDEAVQGKIDELLAQYNKKQDDNTDRAVADGDTVNIDYVGKFDGEPFENGSTEGMGTDVTIGVTNYIDDFLEQLIGHKIGETFDIEVTFPDPYENNPDYAGKDAVFTVTINYITDTIEPEWNDDFVAEHFPEYGSSDEYRQSIYDSMYRENEYNALFSALVDAAEVSEVPESVVDTVYNEQYDYYNTIGQMYYGVSGEELIQYYGMDLESFRSDYCKNYASDHLVIQALMEDLGLTVDKETAMKYMDVTEDDYNGYVEYYGEPYIFFIESTDCLYDALKGNVELVDVEEESSEAGSAEAETEAVTEAETSEAEASTAEN